MIYPLHYYSLCARVVSVTTVLKGVGLFVSVSTVLKGLGLFVSVSTVLKGLGLLVFPLY